MNDNLQSLIRAALTLGGGYLVKAGLVTDVQWQSVIGAVIILASITWSVYQNHQVNAAKTVSAAKGVPVAVPLVGVPTVANATPTATGVADVVKAKAA